MLQVPSGFHPSDVNECVLNESKTSVGIKVKMPDIFRNGIRKLFKNNDVMRKIYDKNHPAAIAYDEEVMRMSVDDGFTRNMTIPLERACTRITPVESNSFLDAVPKVSC